MRARSVSPRLTPTATGRSAVGRNLLGPLALAACLCLPLLVIAASGADAVAYLDPASLLLVLGGTAAATVLGSAPRSVAMVPSAFARTFSAWPDDAVGYARRCLTLAAAVRRDGALGWDNALAAAGRDGRLRRALEQVRDGVAPERIATLVADGGRTAEIDQSAAAAVLRRAADTAPAMGLIGTLLGLVQMLGQLDDPRSVGPALAVALLTTLYGAVLAHAALLPLAERIEARIAAESQIARIDEATVLSVARRENPRLLETTLEALLPEGTRLRFFE